MRILIGDTVMQMRIELQTDSDADPDPGGSKVPESQQKMLFKLENICFDLVFLAFTLFDLKK